MDEHKQHAGHEHWHDSACGHETMESGGHTDYIHDGHRHHEHDGHWDEHVTSSTGNPQESQTPSPTSAI
ncbi:MAG TPA: hypothetical protein VH371_12720 [Candidatus Limnocylindrales bacterium]|jgi:hypothetical protein